MSRPRTRIQPRPAHARRRLSAAATVCTLALCVPGRAAAAPRGAEPATQAQDADGSTPPAAAAPAVDPAPAHGPASDGAAVSAPVERRLAGPPDGRAFSVGLEGVVLTTPPLRNRVIYVDPRFVGRSLALGGLGLFARYRPLSFIGFDAGIRSGSVRLQAEESETTISSDQVMADAAVLLFLGRGEVSQFALSGGAGGLYHRVRYDLDSGASGRQTFGAATFRLGAEAEFLVNRIAFVLSFRTYGIITPRASARTSGELFEGQDDETLKAPVASFQTYLAGSAGIAYRF